MKIIVTGADGFVGRHLVARLRADGHAVLRCVRNGEAGDNTVITGDLATFDGWDAALKGADAVVHLAARVHQVKENASNPEAAFHSANVVATERLVRACERMESPPHLVFMSTIAVMGFDSGNTHFTAETLAPFNPYSRSKAEAEAMVRAAAVPWTVVRIPLVYGAGVRANFLSLMKAVTKNVPLPLGKVHNRRSLLYVGNLVDALSHTLHCDAAREATLLIADRTPLSSSEVVRMLASHIGVKPRLLPIPPAWMHLAARAIGKPMLYHKLCSNLEMDTAYTNALLGWQPPYTSQEAVKATVLWWISTQHEFYSTSTF
jgi:nucleoside-diphosphate-sugar epimerase